MRHVFALQGEPGTHDVVAHSELAKRGGGEDGDWEESSAGDAVGAFYGGGGGLVVAGVEIMRYGHINLVKVPTVLCQFVGGSSRGWE